MTPRTRHVPRLAGDVLRGYFTVAISIIPAFVLQVLIIVAVDLDEEVIYAWSLLLYWSIFSLAYLVVHFVVFSRADASELKHWLSETTPRDRRAKVVHLLNGGGAASYAISGSIIAVAAVLFLSSNERFRSEPAIVYTGIAAVVGSLILTITAYAVRYARQYADGGGFTFPGPEEPRFADFFYLAVQVSTTFSSSDVEVQSTKMRNIVTTNSLISFAFNTVIVALLVSSLIGGGS